MSSNLIHLEAERAKRRGDTPMTGTEVLDELEYLLDAGVHPLRAADQLGRTWNSLTKLAERYGRKDLTSRVDLGAWNRYSFKDAS